MPPGDPDLRTPTYSDDARGDRRELIRRAKLPADPSGWAPNLHKRPLFTEPFDGPADQTEEGRSHARGLAVRWTRKLEDEGPCGANVTLATVHYYLRVFITQGGDKDEARALWAEARRFAVPHYAHERRQERRFQRLMTKNRVLIGRNRLARARPPVIAPMHVRLTRSREGRPIVRRAQRSTGDSGDSDLSDDADPPAAGHRRDRLRHISEALPVALEAMRPEGGSA